MSVTNTETRIETGEHWNGEPTITNPGAFIDYVENNVDPWLTPDGEEVGFQVENPHMNGDPRYLRVEGHRRGLFFRLVEVAHEWGLVVGDAWQHDDDKTREMLCLRLDPVEGTDLGGE